MNRLHRSLLVAVVAGGICGGVGFVQAGPADYVPAAQKLARYEHMHRALLHLHEGRKEIEAAEDIFHGRREEALGHVDGAIHEVEVGLKEAHDEAAIGSALPTANKLERFPHMHAALDRLREAEGELKDADKIFLGRRDRALEETHHAIKQLEDGIHEGER